MTKDPSKLPPKQEVALALLQTASSVYVHLDPRPDDVLVPASFKTQPQLVLQIGLNMAVSIPDLDIGAEAISCTLSFNRTPQFCSLPYSAIYGLVGEDGRGMVWPESVPAEVAAAADGRSPVAPAEKPRRPKLRVAGARPSEGDRATGDGADVPPAVGTEASTEEAAAGKRVTGQKKPKPATSKEKEGSAPPASKKKRELPSYLRVVK